MRMKSKDAGTKLLAIADKEREWRDIYQHHRILGVGESANCETWGGQYLDSFPQPLPVEAAHAGVLVPQLHRH